MTVTIPPDIVPHLREYARREGKEPEQYVLDLLRRIVVPPPQPPVDELMARIDARAVDAGVSLTDEQLSRETMYE